MEDKEKLQKISEILGQESIEPGITRSEYLEFRNLMVDVGREAIRSFDKAMITLSAGALAFSITIIKDIFQTPKEPWLLYVVWFSFRGCPR